MKYLLTRIAIRYLVKIMKNSKLELVISKKGFQFTNDYFR